MATLYQSLVKSLESIGFKRLESHRSKAFHRTWWSAPRFNLNLLKEIIASDGFEVSVIQRPYEMISGVGWSLSRGTDSDDSEWCLTIYTKNKYGQMEEMGIDTFDLMEV